LKTGVAETKPYAVYAQSLKTLCLASSGTIVGAAAYDALIGHCALKAGANILLTWNVRDFTRLGPAISRLVKTPLEL
jgi:predicted nucleic acid-binding protein